MRMEVGGSITLVGVPEYDDMVGESHLTQRKWYAPEGDEYF